MQATNIVDSINENQAHVECVVRNAPPVESAVAAPKPHIMKLSFREANEENREDQRS